MSVEKSRCAPGGDVIRERATSDEEVGVQGVENRRHIVLGNDRAGLAKEVDPGVDVDALFLDVDDEGV